MFTKLLNKFTTTLYIELWKDRVKIIHIKTKYTYEDKTLIVIEKDKNGQNIIMSIGNEASTIPNAINPFYHKRVLFNDFEVDSLIMCHALNRLHKKKYFLHLLP